MKVFAMCMQCQVERGLASFEPFFADYFDDGIAYLTCSAGHETVQLIQSAKFEILMESGANAFLEGFTLEACASFSSALERFYEFALRVICVAREMPVERYTKMFSAMSRQSERQLGAFMILYALEFNDVYTPPHDIIEFRNRIIHKGEIPDLKSATDFISEVYLTIASLYEQLHTKYPDSIRDVMMRTLFERRAKVPNNTPVATNTGASFFSLSHGAREPTFLAAIDRYKKGRATMEGAAPYLRAIHAAIGFASRPKGT